MRWGMLLVTVVGCGHIAFDARSDGGSPDAAVDGAQTPTAVYVQSNFRAATGTNSISVPFPVQQRAGDLAVVAVNDGNMGIVSVTDTAGNVYLEAVAPTGQYGFTMYYAPNISAQAAGANSVTITFVTSGGALVKIAEYGGVVTTTPLDVVGVMTGNVVGVMTGNAATADSGQISTTHAHDLFVAANLTAKRSPAPARATRIA